MGKFSRTKKSNKTSQSIDEKIRLLNRELVKTGMLSEIANNTSDLYSVTRDVPPVPAVPPTLSNVPDTSGITGGGFVQNDNTGDNTGYNDITQLFNNSIGENPTPIIQTPPETPLGGSGLAWHSYTLNGEAVGYIGAGNKFVQVLNPSISGGTDLSYAGEGYHGGNYYTKMALRKSFAEAYIGADHRAYVTIIGSYITWQCWLPYNPYGFGALYNDYTGIKKTDADGSWGLGNVILGIRPNKYTSDPGSPYQPGYSVLVSKNGLGDPNYYPGPIPPAIARGEGKPAPFTEDNYNWYNKVYGLPAAEWYRNNPTTPPSSNPFLPKGAYVPLALGPEIMNKLGVSAETAQTLIAQVVPSGPHTEVYYDKQMKMFVPKGAPQGFPGNLPAQGASIPLGV